MLSYIFVILSNIILLSSNYFYTSNNYKCEILKKFEKNKQEIDKIKYFSTNGTITHVGKYKNISVKFKFSILNKKNSYEAELYSFFKNILSISSKPNYVKVFFNKSNCYIDRSLSNILKKNFDVNLPIDDILYWSIGLPGKSNLFNLYKDGYLKCLSYIYKKSQLITIKYSKYYKSPINLPYIIDILYDGNYFIVKFNCWKIKI
ncbi:MAG: lipoprotein insertase outer membrane protein LolB [Enterobacteriaceae bacterium]